MSALPVSEPADLSALNRLPRDRLAISGGLLLLFIIGVALLAPLIAPYDPVERVGLPFQTPSAEHRLGTDDLGHDIFSQLIYGARLSLLIGFASAGVALLLALTVALTAAYRAGWLSILLLRIVDITLSFPFLPLAIVLAAFLGREIGVTIIAITLVLWARPALILTPQASKIATFQHVTAAKAMGARPIYIVIRHILPRLMPLAIAQFVRVANVAIFLEAAMAFLGLGDPDRISWGTMLYFANASSAMLTEAWRWWVLPVGLALTATIVGLALLGFGIERWADPRLTAAGAPPGQKRHQAAAALISNEKDLQPGEDVALLDIRNLSIWYVAEVDVLAVDRVDFRIKPGEVVGLIGRSGCGKSTLALSLLSLTQAAARRIAGTVLWQGESLFSLPIEKMRGRDISLIPQSAMNALNPVYRVIDQLIEVARHRPDLGDPQTRANESLSLVGIPAERHSAYPHELSGGMRQRVVIAMAVINRPQLVIADEPTTGLDKITQTEILDLILDLQRRFEMGMLIISHDLALIGRVADRLYVMQKGQIVESGPAQTLLQRPSHPHTQQLLQPLPNWGQPLAVGSVAAASETRLVRLDGVSKRYGSLSVFGSKTEVIAVENLSLEIGAGEVVALVGQSGAGKSTVGRLLLGLERPDRGQLFFEGRCLSTLSAAEWRTCRRRMHLIFQDPYQALHPGLTIGRLVAEPLTIGGERWSKAVEKRVEDALEGVGLSPAVDFVGRFPHQLSGGQRQRVALARALIERPRFIVADEPTSMLDSSLRSVILGLIDQMRRENGCGVLLITHDLDIARALGDRIGVMQAGKLVEIGPTEKIFADPQHPYTRKLMQGEIRSDILK